MSIPRFLLALASLLGVLRGNYSEEEILLSGGGLFPCIPDELGLCMVSRANGVLSVADFGARGDGITDDTKAFAATWKAACASSAPTTMLVPVGKTYRLKPITFSGPCKSSVTVSVKGIILASDKISDWTGLDRRLWIMFNKVDGLAVEGGGTINGNGQVWWKISCKVDKKQPCKGAPTAITFRGCNRLRVNDIKFKNSQQIHVTFSKCAGVRISRLSISAPGDSPNTDGIHISGSTAVNISDSIVGTGDDCISIVSGSRAITATNVVCGPGHGISIGSLGKDGAEHTVSDVLVDTARIAGTTNGVRIKTWQGGRGYARNIVFRNIVMDNVKNPIIIDQNYCDSSKPCGEKPTAVAVSGVSYKNIKGTSATAVGMYFDCSRAVPCKGISLQDINIVMKSGGAAKSICRNVDLAKTGTVIPSKCTASLSLVEDGMLEENSTVIG